WAFLIVAVFIAAVAVLATTRPPAAYLASSCNIQPLLPCSQTLLTTNAVSSQRFVVQFTNNLGVPMQFQANAINLTTTNIGNPGVSHFIGNCSPSFATRGAQVLCTVYISGSLRPSPGAQTSTSFTLTYSLCNGGTPSSCQSTAYKSTGLSTQNAAPSNVNFLTVNFITVPSTGSIVLNGVTYPSGVNAVYLPGNYVIFGVPPSGYRFDTWQFNGVSTLSSTSLQNATLALRGNGTLTANFLPGATTSTVTFITTSTSTTSVTSTSTSVTSSSSTTTSTSTSS
ncbi:MAG: hypothetical protein KGH60_05270, partial [Candidatus Micrarchaeota archaeon]|nr:hypothetical protein [Candidatus Micrarchaeota archaeon]